MGVITLPWSMEQDRQNGVKANSVHVDDDFNALLVATNKKLEQDGSIVPTADLPMGSHKITGLATPTANADAATKGYVDNADSTLSASCVKLAGTQTITGQKTFTDTIYRSSSAQYPSGLILKNTLIPTNYNNPASDVNVSVNGLVADDGTFVAYESMAKTAAGVTSASLYVRNRASSSTPNRNAAIGVSIDSAGNASSYAPAPDSTSSTFSTSIATVGWVNDPTMSTNVVHRDGTETITGAKTFSAATTFSNTATFSTSPSVPTVGTLNDNSTKAASTKFVLDILKAIYPVGSIYMGTQSTCPLASLFGTWTRVPSGYAIWTGNGTGNTNASTPNGTTTNANYANANPNSTIAAGLPDIQGTWRDYGNDYDYAAPTGAITQGGSQFAAAIGSGYEFHYHDTTFKASDYNNNIYGKSSTVQPQAYVVNVWRRTA